MRIKKSIVTGAAGFVGSAVIKELLSQGTEVWAIVRPGFQTRLSKSRLAVFPIHLIECDLRNIEMLPELISMNDFDVWYHFAWEGLFGTDLVNYKKQLSNVEWTLNSICAAAKLGCKKFIGSGSITQYELQTAQGISASGDKHCIYKTAKLACEYIGACVAKSSNIEFIWPIITNIYGEGEKTPRLINSMIRNLQAGQHQSLSKGDQIYDFIYIADAAKAFRLIGEYGRENRIYTIASGTARPLREFLVVLRDIVAPNAKLGFGEMEFNGVYLPAERFSIAALTEDTGFVPDVSFEAGIRKTAEWLRRE